MEKFLVISLLIFGLLFSQSVFAQDPVITTKPGVITGVKLAKPIPFNKTLLKTVINKMFIADMKIRIDKDDSFIYLGKTKKELAKIERSVKGVAHTWQYYPLDINSTDAVFTINSQNYFVLTVDFEGEGSEIKGVCPGCKPRFRDRHAPDMQWTNSRQIKIYMKAKAHNNSVTFEIVNVDLLGQLKLNDPMDEMIPHIKFFTLAIKELIEKELKKILDDKEMKDQIANEFAGFLRPLGINEVSKVTFNKTAMLLYP